ncbi:hypothetical protein RJ639_004944 [Escallonia herrerae]|uniref:Uncharacterized protein n=1 Tax=Escallonia herrerae TaxID=1293975 RepID=A0AA88W0Y2_9ASTE|nr:hypothetical protein RJ639_004944 [Escallonia herrerae]
MTSTTAQVGEAASMEVMRNPYEMGTTLINAKVVIDLHQLLEQGEEPKKWVIDSICFILVLLAARIEEPQCPTEVIAGAVPNLVERLSSHDQPLLQQLNSQFCIDIQWWLFAALGLASIAFESLEHVQVVVEHGTIPKLVHLLRCSDFDVAEQALCTLRNIWESLPTSRDLVLSHEALMSLLALVYEHSKLSMLRTAASSVLNFCRGDPYAPFKQSFFSSSAGCNLFTSMKLAYACLEALDSILQFGETEQKLSQSGVNRYAQSIYEYGGWDKILKLKLHRGLDSSQSANSMASNYYVLLSCLPDAITLIGCMGYTVACHCLPIGSDRVASFGLHCHLSGINKQTSQDPLELQKPLAVWMGVQLD